MHMLGRVAKFNLKVGSRRTTKVKYLGVLVIILVVLILLPYSVSEIMVFVGAPTGCTLLKICAQEFLHAPSLYVGIINGSKNVHTQGAQLRRSCTRS